MSSRPAIATYAAAVVIAVAALLMAAATDRRRTAFSLGVPDNQVVATLKRGQELCQGPFRAPRGFSALEFWVKPRTRFRLSVVDAGSRAPRFAVTTHGSGAATGSTTIAVRGAGRAAGSRISVCVLDLSPKPLQIAGGPANGSSGRARMAGSQTTSAMALLFLRPRPPTLLSLLPAVFRRASLYKLSFVGPWTFWLLLGAIPIGLAVLGRALALALREDQPSETPPPAEPRL